MPSSGRDIVYVFRRKVKCRSVKCCLLGKKTCENCPKRFPFLLFLMFCDLWIVDAFVLSTLYWKAKLVRTNRKSHFFYLDLIAFKEKRKFYKQKWQEKLKKKSQICDDGTFVLYQSKNEKSITCITKYKKK